MNPCLPFLKLDPFLFTPLARTPWAGTLVSSYKQRYFPHPVSVEIEIPGRIGESWELSTDSAFPSRARFSDQQPWQPLEEILKKNPAILGKHQNNQGACPLLLKWLSAAEPLSVQLHPPHGHVALAAGECGKPEAWLVVHAEPGSCVYLGFQEGLSDTDIKACLQGSDPTTCLFRYQPRVFDYISVPPGCVHAVGPGLLLVEPQQIVPGLSAKTWRLFDWQRRYNPQGGVDVQGQPRELHVDAGLSAIDFRLPRGQALVQAFVHRLDPSTSGMFLGDSYNPFAASVFSLDLGEKLYFDHHILLPETFSALTLWEGAVQLRSAQQTLRLHGGETVLIAAFAKDFEVIFDEAAPRTTSAQGAFFSLV